MDMHTTAETIRRLEVYGGMDADVLESVARTADWQNKLSFAELEAFYHVTTGPKLTRTQSGRTVETLELRSGTETDASSAVVCEIPYANGISDNWVMHAVRLAGALPDKRIKLMVGNPSSVGKKAGSLTIGECVDTFQTGTLSHTVIPA